MGGELGTKKSMWRPSRRLGVTADVTRREYMNCAENAAVVLYTIRGGGHQWLGGKPIPEWLVGPMTREIDATGLMWAFFREHRLSGK